MVFVGGSISIILGYRLLMAGISGGRTSDGKSREELLTAEVRGARFAMRNLAPGTAFAFFGAAMLTSVALHGPPEIKLDLLGEGRGRAEFRGDAGSGRVDDLAARAMRLVENDDLAGALGLAKQASRRLAVELNDVAWVLLKANGDTQTAFSFSQAAVTADRTNANYLDTLAKVSLANGNRDAAIQAFGRASELDPKYRIELERLKAGSRTK